MAGVLFVAYTSCASHMGATEEQGSTAVINYPGYNTGVKAGNCRLTLVRTTSNTIASLGLNTFSVLCTTEVNSRKARK